MAVVEGVFVARLPAAADALTIFVDLPRALADQRIQQRDQAAGRPLAEVQRRIDQRYFPAHDRYLAERDPRNRARIVVDTSDLQRPVVTRADWPDDPAWAPVRKRCWSEIARRAATGASPAKSFAGGSGTL